MPYRVEVLSEGPHGEDRIYRCYLPGGPVDTRRPIPSALLTPEERGDAEMREAEMREAVAAVELVLGATAPSAESDLTVTEALSLLAGAMVLVLRFLGEGPAGPGGSLAYRDDDGSTTPHTAVQDRGFAVPKIATPSDEELRERRQRILAKLGVTLKDLRARAEQYALVGDEHEAWEDLQSIAFLLGDTRV